MDERVLSTSDFSSVEIGHQVISLFVEKGRQNKEVFDFIGCHVHAHQGKFEPRRPVKEATTSKKAELETPDSQGQVILSELVHGDYRSQVSQSRAQLPLCGIDSVWFKMRFRVKGGLLCHGITGSDLTGYVKEEDLLYLICRVF